MTQKNQFSVKAMILVLTLSLCNWAFAAPASTNQVKEDPSALAMTGDLLVIRPVMFGVTVVGSVLWLVSLPFSAAGGNVKQATDTLVVKPAMNTFVRCLGCTQAGYVKDIE
ncbi:MAG: hypothetical protein ACRBCS_04415 [Cellvibrionaceae bacterium]